MEINKDSISKFDEGNMFDILFDFHTQVETGIEVGQSIEKKDYIFDKIVICGIGGSAISGDILRAYLEQIGYKKQIFVNREYNLPNWVDENTLIVASSYSGNTEETLQAYNEALPITKNIICFTTGGELERFASANGHQVVKLKSGMMPRCALAMSFFAILTAFLHLDIVSKNLAENIEDAIKDTYYCLKKSSKRYGDYTNNEAIKLALLLNGKKVVLYSGKVFQPIVMRWAGQLHENSKAHAFFNIIPEMNHNEINSWDYKENNSDFRIILLKDKSENERVQKRIAVFSDLLKDKANVYGFSSDAEYLLSRMFEMIYFGDWVSYYLALMRGIDPTPIPTITKLKELMAAE
ncbi:bifunctional phosphoglucose/phosphomannose isomerase [bacterium]|nr:MAG: bifunctional phosphoglucose/phosphomannose isomerase [bacterium]